jgi:hypothetical protein
MYTMDELIFDEPITEINDDAILRINKAYNMTTEQIVDMFRAEAKKKKIPIGRKKVDKIMNAYNWIKPAFNQALEQYNEKLMQRKPRKRKTKKSVKPVPARDIILEDVDDDVPLRPKINMKWNAYLNAYEPVRKKPQPTHYYNKQGKKVILVN